MTMVESTNIGIAGEFYVLAQLAQRGLIASFTLANTKAIDILVFDESLDKLCKLEVKTSILPPRKETLFSDEPVYSWPMFAKHERVADPRLFFCFVVLKGACTLPLFFIVPSSYVADYVREQHLHWIRTRTRPVNPTSMRQFRIRVSDPLGFKDNWSLLSGRPPLIERLSSRNRGSRTTLTRRHEYRPAVAAGLRRRRRGSWTCSPYRPD
jgi:hypothetical protein